MGKQGEGKDNGEIGDTSAGRQALLMLLLTEQSCSGKVSAVGLPAPCLIPLTQQLAPAHPWEAQPHLGGTCWQGLMMPWPGHHQNSLQGGKVSKCSHSSVAWGRLELGEQSKKGGVFLKKEKGLLSYLQTSPFVIAGFQALASTLVLISTRNCLLCSLILCSL